MELRPQDVVVVLKLLASDFGPWSYAKLGQELGMSASHVFASVGRAESARLLTAFNLSASPSHQGPGILQEFPVPNRSNLKEFLIHGVKYAFPAERGGPTRGIPTAEAAPPLSQYFPQHFPLPPVWPYAGDDERATRGIGFFPLYKNVPEAALRHLRDRNDPTLYELLALVDAIREGRAREREIAIRELTARIDRVADRVKANSL